MLKAFRALALTCLIALGSPLPASAALTWLGATQISAAGGVLDDVAYDDKHDVYLHVWETGRNVWARFVGSDGAPKGAAFVIGSNFVASFAGGPRVAYSSGTTDDIFFVGFSSDYSRFDRGKNVFGQMVRYTGAGATGGTLVGSNFPMSASSLVPTIFQTLTDVIYNPAQRQFFAVWDDSRGATDVFGRLFDVNGAAVAAEINITSAPWSQGAASVALDVEHNRYFVVYQGLHPQSPTFPELTGAWAKVLDGRNATLLSGLIEMQRGGSPIEMNAVYLPQTDTFLGYWTGFRSDGKRQVFGRQVPYNHEASGSFATGVYPVMSSAGEGGADGAYNSSTNTVLLAAMFVNGRIRGAELAGDGTIITPSFTMSTIVARNGSFWPRVASGPGGQFAFVYGVDFASAWLERYSGVVTATPTNPTPDNPTTSPAPAPPPAPISVPLMAIDLPSASSIVSTRGFFVSGWALDRGATSGAGVDFVHVYAWPVGGGNPTFLGAATIAVPMRPDVASFYGSQFTGSGYSLTTGPLPAGTYDIAVYAHSIVGNTIDGRLTRVTAVAPSSIPRMWVDSPAQNQEIPQNFVVQGWALDVGSTTDAGVDAIHVYAYPAGGATPVFVGAATLGTSRLDVAQAFGSGRFNNSGFQLNGMLAHGDYTLVVFARSSVSGNFNNAQVVQIRVR